jgi:hypothetical protein
LRSGDLLGTEASIGTFAPDHSCLGLELAIVLSTPSGILLWGGDIAGGYSGGQWFLKSSTTVPPLEWQAQTGDLGFRTFVEAVPEPSAFLLLVLGLAAVGLARSHASDSIPAGV